MDAVEQFAEVRYATVETLADALPGSDVLLVWDFFSRALQDAWPAADSLRWIHVAAAGVDTLLFDELVNSDVVVTNSRGVFDRPIAEFVLASILAFAKDVPASLRLQNQRQWRHRETEQISGSRAIVVGTGAIGREIARLLRAVGVEVSGAGRRARSGDPDFGEVRLSDELAGYIGDADYLVLVAPLTEQTEGMVDASVLAAMKPTARLVNVGRGELVVTDALVDALRKGRIAGAALDVFDTEPLPPQSPLWDMESVLISPHMSGDAAGWRERLAGVFVDNAERYRDGLPLLNVVDKQRGYVPSA
ncbi:D-2-hydroxyacid dehydrogenase [Rhodococcus sp. HNM0569]|nr:D-2-hydroxyacid dehydrogenase [Rhodococcus sp. HNM0569]